MAGRMDYCMTREREKDEEWKTEERDKREQGQNGRVIWE